MSPSKPEEVTYEEIVKKVKEHYSPRPHKTLARFRLWGCVQQPEQACLKPGQACEYGALLEDMVWDQFTFGLRNEALQKKIVGVGPRIGAGYRERLGS